MPQDKPKKIKAKKKLQIDKKVTEVIKIMANTPPISNEELKKRNKQKSK